MEGNPFNAQRERERERESAANNLPDIRSFRSFSNELVVPHPSRPEIHQSVWLLPVAAMEWIAEIILGCSSARSEKRCPAIVPPESRLPRSASVRQIPLPRQLSKHCIMRDVLLNDEIGRKAGKKWTRHDMLGSCQNQQPLPLHTKIIIATARRGPCENTNRVCDRVDRSAEQRTFSVLVRLFVSDEY